MSPALSAIEIRRRARRRALLAAAHRFWAIAAEKQAQAEQYHRQKRAQAKSLEELTEIDANQDYSYMTYQHAAQLCEEWAKEKESNDKFWV